MDAKASAAFSLGQDTTGEPWCFTNHGSYGAVPLPVARVRTEMLARVERNPDIWFRVESYQVLEQVMEQAAKFVGADAKDMSFVTNATEGVNCVLTSLEREAILGPESGILFLSLAYGAVKNTLFDVGQRTRTPVEEVCIPVPLSSMDHLVDLVTARLNECPNIRVAVLDHITSQTAVMLPLDKLVAVCRERNVRVVVDGAHAIGQIPNLNMRQLGADYYVSNFHKWAFAPKGSAFLYCAPRHQPSLQPSLVSWCYREADWRQRFGMQGTRDLTTFATVGAALDFVHKVGFEKAHKYRVSLRDEAITVLVSRWWGSQVREADMLIAPRESIAPYMAVIKTPIKDTEVAAGSSPLAARLFQTLYLQYRVILPLTSFQGFIYCRISVQIYNSRRDYERVAAVISRLANTHSHL